MDADTKSKNMYAHAQLRNVIDFNTRVELLYTMDINGAGGAVDFIQYFEDVNDKDDPFEAALKVAQAFNDAAGLIVSYGTDKYKTILDDLNDQISSNTKQLFIRAFKQLGIKNAIDYDKKDMYTSYILQFLNAKRSIDYPDSYLYQLYAIDCIEKGKDKVDWDRMPSMI